MLLDMDCLNYDSWTKLIHTACCLMDNLVTNFDEDRTMKLLNMLKK